MFGFACCAILAPVVARALECSPNMGSASRRSASEWAIYRPAGGRRTQRSADGPTNAGEAVACRPAAPESGAGAIAHEVGVVRQLGDLPPQIFVIAEGEHRLVD